MPSSMPSPYDPPNVSMPSRVNGRLLSRLLFYFRFNGLVMHQRTYQFLAGLILLPSLATAPALGQQKGYETFKISTNKYFAQPKNVLSRLAAQKGTTRKNTFCVVGYRFPDGGLQGWVYWKEGKAIILWEPLTEGTFNLARSKRYIRIPGDVVATEEDVKGSTYRMTKHDVDKLIEECRREGEYFTVFKR